MSSRKEDHVQFIRFSMIRTHNDYNRVVKYLETPITKRDREEGLILDVQVVGWWFEDHDENGDYLFEDGILINTVHVPEFLVNQYKMKKVFPTHLFPILIIVHGTIFAEILPAFRCLEEDKYWQAWTNIKHYDELF